MQPTDDQITVDVADAIKRYDVGVKCAGIKLDANLQKAMRSSLAKCLFFVPAKVQASPGKI